jgi:hypothetical protein
MTKSGPCMNGARGELTAIITPIGNGQIITYGDHIIGRQDYFAAARYSKAFSLLVSSEE